MSTSTKPKRIKRPKLAALFLLGTDAEVYACTSVANLPEGVLKNPNVVVAIRLSRVERDLVLDTIHTEGVIEAAKTIAGILRPDA